MTVTIVTDSGSDLTPTQLAEGKIRHVPLSVSLGDRSYMSPDELTPEEFWRELLVPGCPFPHTAAPSAGQFKQAFEDLVAKTTKAARRGMEDIKFPATFGSAQIAKEMLPGRPIDLVDSHSASLATGALAMRGARLAAEGASAADIVEQLERVRERTTLFVVLETLEYLRKGGRISHARAALGGLLSVKPIIRKLLGCTRSSMAVSGPIAS